MTLLHDAQHSINLARIRLDAIDTTHPNINITEDILAIQSVISSLGLAVTQLDSHRARGNLAASSLANPANWRG